MVDSVTLSLSAVSLKEDAKVVKILVDSKELRCSKQLLVQNSKYFKAYFAFHDQLSVIQLNGGIDYDSTKTILDGLANPGGKIDVDEENVQSILQASAFLQCATAEKASADFMLANLNLANAYSIFMLALSCGSAYLAETSEAFILNQVRTLRLHVTSVMDLLQMDVELLKGTLELIEDNHVAFSTACGWLLYDLEERSGLLDELLASVIVEIIPPDALNVDGLEDHPVIVEALRKSIHYDALALRGKINYWEDQLGRYNLSKWPKLGIVCSTGNNSSAIAYRYTTSRTSTSCSGTS